MNENKYDRDWEEIFEYDASVPSGLVRAKDVKYTNIKKGDMAGYQTFLPCGRPKAWEVKFKGRVLMVHRLIYILVNGTLSNEKVIDHIAGNPFNNVITNLREVSQKTNCQNKRKNKNNSTNIVGVCWTEKTNGKYLYAKAEVILKEGRKLQKYFSVNKLGLMPAFKMACIWRYEKLSQLNSDSEEYTERHFKGG